MKAIVVTSLALLASAPVLAQTERAYEQLIYRWYDDEQAALRQYDRGEYERAFDNLSVTAVRGLKRSQYILAFMYLKGQHVEKSIPRGMGWLGVSVESGNEEWQRLYDSLYGKLAPEHRGRIDEIVTQYIARYGGDAQGVTCSKSAAAGTRRLESRCRKVEGNYTICPVEQGQE